MGSYDRGIYLPSIGETGWGSLVDDNFSRLSDLGYNTLANDVVADGIADDTAAFQAIIDAVPSGSGTVPQTARLAPGTIRITDTITISGRAPRLLGSGIGNATDYTAPGEGTTIFWDGPAGDPMFVVEDSRHVLFQDFHIEGNSTNPPSDLIFFDGTPHGHGSNELIYLNRMRLGVGYNSTRTTDGTTCATYGLRFGGANTNNDQFRINDTVVHGVETGLYLPNSQSVWGGLSNVFFNRCTTAAIRTSANLRIDMLTVNDCAIDVRVDDTAQVDVFGWYSEGTDLMASVTGNSGKLRVYGGDILVKASYAGANLVEASFLGGLGGLELHGVSLNDAQNGFVMPKIYVRGNNSSDRSTVVIDDCDYLEQGDLDIQAHATGGGIYCRINVAGQNIVEHLTAGEALSTTVAHTEFAGPVITSRAQLADAATTGFLYVPSTAGAPTGTPETHTGTFPIAYDQADHRLYLYDGDWLYFTGNLRLLVPGSITGLLAWYDFTDATTLYTDTARTTLVTSDGDNIKGVTDKSGNGYHLAEGTNPPKHRRNVQNSQHVARFNGTNQFLSDTTFPSSALPLTIFAIGNTNATANQKNVVDGITARASLIVENDGNIAAYAGGAQQHDANDAEGGWHEFHASITDAAASVLLGFDGEELATNSAGSQALAGLRIGTNNNANGNWYDGDLAHVIIVSGAMTAADRRAAARWLGNELTVTIA